MTTILTPLGILFGLKIKVNLHEVMIDEEEERN